ncbi:MAG: hypothetical protein ACLUNV_09785 [Sutterella wadsworthensis]
MQITRFVRTQADFTQHVMSDEMRVHRYRLQYLIYLCGAQALPQGEAGRDYDDSLLGGASPRVPARRQRRCPARPRRHPGRRTSDPVGAERIARLDELFLPEGQK